MRAPYFMNRFFGVLAVWSITLLPNAEAFAITTLGCDDFLAWRPLCNNLTQLWESFPIGLKPAGARTLLRHRWKQQNHKCSFGTLIEQLLRHAASLVGHTDQQIGTVQTVVLEIRDFLKSQWWSEMLLSPWSRLLF